MPTFAFHSRYALLTYAQCGHDLDPFRIVELFAVLSAECIIGREVHEDGGIHLHVFVDFGRKRRFRDARKFDVDDYHPNIVPSRGNPGDGWDYATKDGDVIAGGLDRPGGGIEGAGAQSELRGAVRNSHAAWTRIVAAEDREEFLDLCKQLAPERLVCSWSSIVKYADWRYARVLAPYTSPSGHWELGAMAELNEWSDRNLGVAWQEEVLDWSQDRQPDDIESRLGGGPGSQVLSKRALNVGGKLSFAQRTALEAGQARRRPEGYTVEKHPCAEFISRV